MLNLRVKHTFHGFPHIRRMPSMGERIKEARTKKKWSQERLGKALRVSKAAVSQWESDQTEPTGPNLIAAAAALRVDPAWLVLGRTTGFASVRDPIVRVPLISWVKATTFTDVTDPYEPGDSEGEVEVAYGKDTLIALRVEGSSMNRVAPEGSVIIVDYSDKTLVSGRCYIIKWEGKATFKRYRSNPDRFEPESTESHDIIFPTGPIEVVGRVVRQQNDI